MSVVWDDDYHQLVEDAASALHKLFDAARPDAWMRARLGYGELRAGLDLYEKARDLEELRADLAGREEVKAADRVERELSDSERREKRQAWLSVSTQVKLGWILNALGDDALIQRELHKRVEAAHSEVRVYDTDLSRPLRLLREAGELTRDKEPRGPNCVVKANSGFRWRYRRSTHLTPEVRDLERRLREA